MSAPTRYERWTGLLPSDLIPARETKSRDASPIAAPILVEVADDPAPIFPVGTKSANAASYGRLGGLKGGPARAKALSPKKRKAIAQKAATARWKVK